MDPCGGVIEIGAAGAVEGLLGRPDGGARGKERVLILFAAGGIEGEAPLTRVARVAKPAERPTSPSGITRPRRRSQRGTGP